LVAADDRTGAFEVAALFAEVVGPVVVTVGAAPRESGVVDIATRTMTADAAALAAAGVDSSPSAWIAHKIDSTLRGNWVAELRARQRATGRRVVVLPGWPEMGRTCAGGVVSVDGVSIGSVLDRMRDAELMGDAGQLRAWLDGDGMLAVCDVPDSDAMHSAAAVLAGHKVLIAGPAGPLGAAFAADRGVQPREHRVLVESPVLVVCGSAHHVAREQIQRLQNARPDVEILETPVPDGALHAEAVAALAVRAMVISKEREPGTIVIIGGETAAALLGAAPRSVVGFAAAGMPCTRHGSDSLIITKAGGFGGPDALVELLRGENG
jgi:uncharacterized protein YgbK (DUF1537 family)